MKLLLACYSLIAIGVFLASCTPIKWNPPTEQENTIWAAQDYKIYFCVNFSEDTATIGELLDMQGNNIAIKLLFGYDFTVIIYDNNVVNYEIVDGIKMMYKLDDAQLISGDFNNTKTKLTITVTQSNTDSINVGDIIVFNRVDEIPEWADALNENIADI